jgi:hypothetical protein
LRGSLANFFFFSFFDSFLISLNWGGSDLALVFVAGDALDYTANSISSTTEDATEDATKDVFP